MKTSLQLIWQRKWCQIVRFFYKLSEKKHDHLLANGAKFLVRRGNFLQEGETNSARVVSNYVCEGFSLGQWE